MVATTLSSRIAIARAILKDPCILLLGEATSSLDNEIGRTWARGAQPADAEPDYRHHRASAEHNQSGHRIAVLESGGIIELGAHAELMEHNGLYTRLYSMQFRDLEEELAGLRDKRHDKLPKEPSVPEKRVGLLDMLRTSG